LAHERWVTSVFRRKPVKTYTYIRRLTSALLAALAALPCVGQTAPASVAPAASNNKDDTIVLSPFEVVPDDVGYQAGNTTSGSRLNTSLKDTPASISVFTPEFLSDLAANNLSEMLGYATNVEAEVEDSNQGFTNPSARTADGTAGDFRVRGIAGSFAVYLL
jgi:outer membrane receptor for ferric coprogen and ferric-rhodotorulic acid